MKAIKKTRSDRNIRDIAGAKKILEFLREKKALDLALLPMENSFADALIVATATSRRNAQGLADALAGYCHENGQDFLGMEGYEAADWILVDCNDIIINIFLEETRNLYKLEDLWGGRESMKEILP